MGKFRLAIGLHNHQPVGNFDSVFEEAHTQAYLPFLKVLEKFPNARLSLHQSGILWDWQEKHHPEYFDTVRQMIARGQIELMTGGFYEPILPSIPDRDKLGQIALLNQYLSDRFETSPSGLWLTERVWEPHLPKILNQAGVTYLPIDDTHFLYAGFELSDLTGIFVTEESGLTVRLLPIQKKLRYLIPFGTVEKVMTELMRQAERNPNGLAIYADDGEKFGVWPKTHQHCYDDGWLEQFFTALQENSGWLEICTLGDAAQSEPVGRAYLPSASYAEMLHWSLPPKAFAEYEDFEHWLEMHGQMEQYGRYVRGGHWRGFLAKYEEANLMHKRMLAVSDALDKFIKEFPDRTDLIEKARRRLYAGQCNCPYWHGVFGGLYLPHLRAAIYENLIEAEKIITESERRQVSRKNYDYDCDGHDEVVVRTQKFAAIFKPSVGGMLLELDSYDGKFNFSDTLRRRKEGYHWKLAKAKLDSQQTEEDKTASIHDLVLTKELGLDKLLADDWYSRRGFVDHFLPQHADINLFQSGHFNEEGDFALGKYESDKKGASNIVSLKRNGHLWRAEGIKELTVEKVFYFADDSDVFSVNYCLYSERDDIYNIRFAVENNFNFQAGHADDRYLIYDGARKKNSYLDSVDVTGNCYTTIIRDDYRRLAVALALDKPAEVWQVPIFTISLSEGGFEKVYQGTTLLHIFNFHLMKGQRFEITFLTFAGPLDYIPKRFVTTQAGAIF